jgi:hypothetical protein
MKLERSALVNSAVLALALATGTALVLTRERPTTSEREARANNLFPSFPRERMVRLSVQSQHPLELSLERAPDGGSPTYTLAGGIPADPEAAESLLRGLEMAAFYRRFSNSEVDREKFGLAKPRATLRAEFTHFALTLLIGKEALTPSGNSYVAAQGQDGEWRVGLMRSDAVKELLVGPDDLRPRALVPYGLSELSAVAFHDAGVDVAVKRGKGPAWLDARGQRVRRDTIEHLVFELGTLKAEPFLELGAARAALERDGALSATFTLKASGTPLSLRVGSTCPTDPARLVAERMTPTPAAACVAGGLRRLFTDVAGNLQDTSLFALHGDEVESLLIEREGKKLELARSERGFLLRSPARAEVALNVGNGRLDALLEAHGELVNEPDLAAFGLALPLGTVRLRSSSVEGSELFDEVVELGRPRADGQLPVRRREDGRVLLVPREAARAYSVDSTLLRSPKLLDFGPSDVSKLEVSWDGEREVLERGPAGTLDLVEPKGMQHDGALALELLQALGTMHTDRWVADLDDGSFGFQHPRAKAAVTLRARDAGPAVATLVVGGNTAGGAFAELDTSPGVFVLESSVVTRLTTLLLTRALLGDAPASFERAELVRHGKTLAFVKRGNDFVAAPGSEIPPPLVARAVESLTNLRAEAALHTGPDRADEGFTSPTLLIRLVPKAGSGAPRVVRFGASDTFQELRIFYARKEGTDATYAVAQSAIRELLDLF